MWDPDVEENGTLQNNRTVSPTRRTVLAAALGGFTGCLGTTGNRHRECPPAVGTDDRVRIGLTGDVMLGRNVNDRWIDAEPMGVWDGLATRLQRLDGFLANLECCVSSRGQRQPGRTFYFRANPEWAVAALTGVETTWVSLANNHILDFGTEALGDTVTNLESAGIETAGAGEDIGAAFEPSHVEIDGLDVAIVAVTDQAPLYAARTNSPGAAYVPLDPSNPLTRQLLRKTLETAVKSSPDLVIASLHWGPNWEVEPSETQQSMAHWLIDEGVDVVHGHSAHVIQGIEIYRGRPIIYDAGDFVDDYVVKEGLHNDRSFLFELLAEDGQLSGLALHPVEIGYGQVTRASEPAANWLRSRMRTLSEPFGTQFRRMGDGLSLSLSC